MPNQPRSPILGVRLPADLKAWVTEHAKRLGTSPSDYVRDLITRDRATVEPNRTEQE